MSKRRSILALAAASVLWLPVVHLAYRPGDAELADTARALAAEQLSLWSEPLRLQETLDAMRASNAEWDFMARTYLVLAFANLALREPDRAGRYLAAIDRIIEATLDLESRRGQHVFLMPYARASKFVADPPRSVFVDGEIALMLGARRIVREDGRLATLHRERVALIANRMRASPVLSAESYPNEAWTFCNTTALAAIRISDALDGTDHRPLFDAWIRTAQRRLTDVKTGLLISSYTFDGAHLDGPEGSSIFMSAHNLALIDRDFARDQYQRAKRELARTLLGFGYAREWPVSWTGPEDIDSGPSVPILGANPGASGMAILGAAAFGDREMLRALVTSMELAAFPIDTGAGGRRYAAGNAVADAVVLYSLVQGPLWSAVDARAGGDSS